MKNGARKLYEWASGGEAAKSRERVQRLEDQLNRVDEEYEKTLAVKAAEIDELRDKLDAGDEELAGQERDKYEKELAEKERELEKLRNEIRLKVNDIIAEYHGIYAQADSLVRQKKEQIPAE